VDVERSASELRVLVENSGLPSNAARFVEGNGIVGMRERALSLGGEFTAGPRPGGGFAVRARMPVEGPE
jgi:signal transduction histidine kinase